MMWLVPLLLATIDSASLALPVAPAETLHVTVTGSGEPVVLIPGLFGSAFGFRRLIPLLSAAGCRTIVIEPLGIGASGRPERADYSLTAQADRIAAALDTLGVAHAIIVAHSVGASMAYRLAYRRPDLVRAIVSLEGGPAEAAATPSFRRAMRFVPWIKWFGGIRRIRGKIKSSLVASSGDTSWVTDSVVDAYTAGAAADLDGTLKALLRMADAREPERLIPRLGAIHCPVRLLVGTAPHQGGVPPGDVDALRAGLPSLTIDSVRGSGHYIQEEHPHAVLDAVVAIARPAHLHLSTGVSGQGPSH
jgi:pimeloyl-ACP methyl ester carboxylesterase